MIKLNKILFPTDFSRCANQVLAHALYLARQYQAERHVLHVTVLPEGDPRTLTHYIVNTEDYNAQFESNGEPADGRRSQNASNR